MTKRYDPVRDDCRMCGRLLRTDHHRRSETEFCSKGCHAYANRLQREYGLIPEDFHAMLIEQSGRCATCGDIMTRPHVDHSHFNGRIRGLLCALCNFLIGHMETAPRRRLYGCLDYIRDTTFTHEAVVGVIH